MTGYLRMAKLDFLLMKSQIVSYLSLVIIVFMFGLMGSSITLLGINGAWFMALMSINVFAIQEKNNLERLYGSVSVRWKDIILGRYISIFLSYVTSFILVIIVYLGFSLFQNRAFELSEVMVGFSLSFLAFSAIIGVEIPMLFRMGYTKARAWALLPYLIVLALIFAPPYLSALFGGAKDFPSFSAALSEIIKFMEIMASKQVILIVCGIVVGCLIQYLSYQITLVVYRKRR